MLLRDKISILFVAAVLLLAAGLLGAGWQRERLAESRFAEVATDGQRALWVQTVAAETRRLADLGTLATRDPELQQAVAAGDRTALWRAVNRLYGAQRIARTLDLIEIADAAGTVLFTSDTGAGQRGRVLDLSALGRAAGGETVAGLWQDSPDRYLVLHAFALDPGALAPVVVTLAVDGRRLLEAFGSALGTPALILSARGRVVEATGAAETSAWAPLVADLPLRRASVATIDTRRPDGGTTVYSVTGVPVRDLSGGHAGTVVTFRDATATLGEAQEIALLTLAGAALFVVLTVMALHLFLRRAFRPLGEAIGVLRALAQGDTSVTLEARGSDEIGRIAEAVRAFRANAVALGEAGRSRERQRRRQERFIRKQMESLADALDPAARQEILDDLSAAFSDAAAAAEPEAKEQLGVIAAVLRQLSARVVEQNQRLSTMVVELREALVTKTKLIGLQQELEIARQVQLAMVPTAFPVLPGFDIHGHMLPAKEVGGDFYDVFPIDEHRHALVVGDVSGKGVPAALFMAIAKTLIKATARYERRPGACIAQVNALLAAENDQMLFVTLFYGVYDQRDGSITYVNAGHNPPCLIDRAGQVSLLPTTGGIAVAIMDDATYQEATVTLAPGDAILVYTDGVTEAFDIDGEQFGEARLETLAADLAGAARMSDLVDGVFEAIRLFERGASQSDDITGLALRRTGPPAPGLRGDGQG